MGRLLGTEDGGVKWLPEVKATPVAWLPGVGGGSGPSLQLLTERAQARIRRRYAVVAGGSRAELGRRQPECAQPPHSQHVAIPFEARPTRSGGADLPYLTLAARS